MMQKLDQMLYGAIAGLLLPFLGYAAGKQIIFTRGSWHKYWDYFVSGGDHQNQIFTFCMLPTLFLFYFVFFVWKMEKASRGLVAISLVEVALFMAFKFL